MSIGARQAWVELRQYASRHLTEASSWGPPARRLVRRAVGILRSVSVVLRGTDGGQRPARQVVSP